MKKYIIAIITLSILGTACKKTRLVLSALCRLCMREADWDVAGHGYRWEIHGNFEPDHERKQIELATASIARTIGTRPLGWYSRYAPSLHTRKLLLEAGYEYDSETYNDELPYWVKVGARQQLVVPYSLTHNDVRFARQGMTSGDEYLAYIKNAVQCVLEEDPPRMLADRQRLHATCSRPGARPRARLAGR